MHCPPLTLQPRGTASRWLTRCLVSTVMGLAACGGGGGDQIRLPDSEGPGSTPLPEPEAPPSTISGVVAVGAPVVGASVTARCATGEASARAPTDAAGAYEVPLVGVAPPCLLQALGGSTTGGTTVGALHGIALAAGPAHLNPLTQLALAQATGADPAAAYAAARPSATVPSITALQRAATWVGDQLVALGLARPAVDLYAGRYAIGDATDLLIDGLQAATQAHASSLQALTATAAASGELHETLRAAKAAADAAAALAAEEAARANAAVAGTAVAGGAVVDAAVSMRCAAGTPQAGQRTDAQGGFRVKLQGATPPCLVQVSGGMVGGAASSRVLHGWGRSIDAAVPVTPLSDLALAWAWGRPAAEAMATAEPWPVPAPAQIDAAAAYVAAEVEALGLTRPSDVVATAVAAGDATDRLAAAYEATLDELGSDTAAATALAGTRVALAAAVKADKTIHLDFVGVAGSTPVRCGGPLITGLGSGGVSARLLDFRFYVSAIELLRANGAWVALQPGADHAWQATSAQGEHVALVDLEDGSAECAAEGTAGTNARIAGRVPAGRYRGLRYTLGVPESMNHTDTARAPAPLDLVAMGWSWLAGRKYAKIEVTEPTSGAWASDTFFVHLGATGCSGNPGLGTVVCTRPNRALVRLDGFEAGAHRIAVDVQSLLAGTDITRNQGGAQGCMSAANDRDCLAVFQALGIDWRVDGSGTGLPVGDGRSQSVFKAVPR